MICFQDMEALSAKWGSMSQKERDEYTSKALALWENYKQAKEAVKKDLERRGLLKVKG